MSKRKSLYIDTMHVQLNFENKTENSYDQRSSEWIIVIQ